MSLHSLYTVAYLEVSEMQMNWMQELRRKHDPHYTVVDPHFTLAFAVRGVEQGVYLDHIATIASETRPISFHCKYAMLGADNIDDTAYVFLVPDEGYSDLSLLHDRLYRGVLEPFHRLEFPYIPHISIAGMKDFKRAKRLCDELNSRGVHVHGQLASITTGFLKDGKFCHVQTFELAA
ncbi:2'-5' RNA ligase family protein [Nitrincola iocasae]|uniref:2'-5' RNA ligase n=1 Tax=Nitrincola iocasae TaxID=2614693 RepID=A0A5J6LDC9_9GAMM|nr:2'-5' RNA ligase family protein [Nitrincola iocasae]QEW06629.1 hypothetical protein F5I99_09005 [Nitrincola iocasae]